MDRLERYRQIVRTFLEEYAQESVSPNENVTAELIFDEKRDHYLLVHVHVGWQGARRIYGCPMQIDIIDNKVWLQHNATEIFVDQELIARGIPEDDMVLGLQSPRIRELVAAKKKNNSISQQPQNEFTNLLIDKYRKQGLDL
ncbi:XisI protein [Pseudanabaena yagii]|uniref:XisI protein n=1 Tax=Pseudanabaena yagii GIHE-NHR1 TaxID=2722753 RepID=A0ABX1LMH5_9CYAN|nr:XisI protein [Pseudanabaena yagii]NMF57334.1 XisI protein [Pseudanabaena yagii GIHE-NHR1]